MGEGSGDPAVAMAIFAALTYGIISATNSSPQTTEINAKKRGPTLMKWVQIGLGQTALFVLIGVAVQARAGRPIWPPVLGAGLAGGMLWAQYQHALNSGLASVEPGTETY